MYNLTKHYKKYIIFYKFMLQLTKVDLFTLYIGEG